MKIKLPMGVYMVDFLIHKDPETTLVMQESRTSCDNRFIVVNILFKLGNDGPRRPLRAAHQQTVIRSINRYQCNCWVRRSTCLISLVTSGP